MKSRIEAILTNKKFLWTLGTLFVAGVLFLLVLDNLIMPDYTNYKEGLTVPDITQVSLDEAKETLTSYGLRFEVAERRSNDAYPANYVIDQNPVPSSIVKPNRKVYLTVNTETNPTVKVPEVVDLSQRNARIQLQNSGLKVGTISYESSRFKNSVLQQSIPPETVVPLGTPVDLIVSDGLGEKLIPMPDIKGLRLSEAQQKLQAKGLRVGEFEFRPDNSVPPNVVIGYRPQKEQFIEGERVKLIISEQPRTEPAN